jgi:hypothetical protein
VPPPILRDVALALPRVNAAGSAIPPLEARVSCWTGRHAQPCTVQATYRELLAGGGQGPEQTSTPSGAGAFHQLVLGDLTPGASYRFQLTATDQAVPTDQTTSQVYHFTHTPDRVPPEPVVSGITVDQLTATGARIRWTTAEAEPAGQVNYGPTEPPGSVASETGTQWRTAHGVTLSGLTADTEYRFQIFQPGWRGNSVLTPIDTFTTPAA